MRARPFWLAVYNMHGLHTKHLPIHNAITYDFHQNMLED